MTSTKNLTKQGVFFLPILLMVLFSHWNFNLKYIFPIELLLIVPIIISHKKIAINNTSAKIMIPLLGLAVLNIFSSFNGEFSLSSVNLLANLAVSITYILMYCYYIFGIILIERFNLDVINKICLFLLALTFIIVLFESLFAEVKLFLIDFYGISDIESLESSRYRSIGPFKNPNNLAVMTAFLLAVVVGKQMNNMIKIIICVGAGYVIALSGSRTGLILFLFIAFYEYMVKAGSIINRLRNMIILFFLILIFINATELSNTALFSRVGEAGLYSGVQQRGSIYWNDAYELISQYPILGTGLIHNESATSDNFYITLLKTNGIVGFFLFLLPIIFCLKFFLKRLNNQNISGPILLIFIFFMSSFTGDFYFSRPFYPFFFTILGIYMNLNSKVNFTMIKLSKKDKTVLNGIV